MKLPPPNFTHLLRLSDDTGIVEHAWYAVPRSSSGYTVDDVARALIAICRQPAPSVRLQECATRYLAFLYHARLPGGGFHNRLSYARRWCDDIGSDDCHGRALWALGTAALRGPTRAIQGSALRLFETSARLHSRSPRANAFAVLGAAEVLAHDAGNEAAWSLLLACEARLPPRAVAKDWPWPEHRLAYDNARLPHAQLLIGRWMQQPEREQHGLDQLRWLVDMETQPGHFSFVPTAGWGGEERRPQFDQQPLEAAAMADACATALAFTGDPAWAQHVVNAAEWFTGLNDVGVSLYDQHTGGCCDGLTLEGVNENQGAESTLACIMAFQQGRRCADAQFDTKKDTSIHTL